MDRLDLEVKFATEDDTGLFAGYASLFGGEPDAYGDTVAPGAFARSLAEHKAAGTRPLMLWMHDPAEPVGVWLDVKEDAAGLAVTGMLVLETVRGREAYALLKAGALNGLSIGFRMKSAERRNGGRVLTDVDLIEVSLVTVPAASRARIHSVKSAPADTNAAEGAAQTEGKTMEQQTAAPDLSGIEARIGELAGTVKTLTERTDKMEAKANRPGAIETKGADTEVKSFNTFVRKGKEALGADEVKSLRVADDTSGGYLAPAQFVAELMKNLVLYSPVRSVARVAPTGQGAVILPKRTGTTTAAWVGETEDRPETAPAYGQAEYTVRELSAYIDISNTMLEDAAFDMAAELASDFAEEFGKAEGAAFVNGNGVKKPMGFMADSAVLHTLNGHATNLSSDALVKLFHDTPGAYAANGVWMMNRTTIGVVRTLKDGAGRYLWQEPLSAGNPATILGRPVAEAPDMDDVAAGAFPIAFGDFRQGYRIFDRVALSVLRDPYSQATKGMTRFHARRRVAGGVGKAEAIRKLKMATS